MEDLIIKKEGANIPAKSVIAQCVATLPGGAVLDLSRVGNAKVLYAGHPVVQGADGKWTPVGISKGKYQSFSIDGTMYNCGVLANDVNVDYPVADIMLIGVVDASASAVAYTPNFNGKEEQLSFVGEVRIVTLPMPFGGITFINMPNE